jgi:hypothetical protein
LNSVPVPAKGQTLLSIPDNAIAKENTVSSISEDEAYFPPDHELQVSFMRKPRINWTPKKEQHLLACYSYYKQHHQIDRGLKGSSWKHIAHQMSQQFHEEFETVSCRNKMNALRMDYAIYKDILEARQCVHNNDERFWAELRARDTTRAMKWEKETFPHYEMMKKIDEIEGTVFVFFRFFSLGSQYFLLKSEQR